jgi:hypothetical protein
VFVTDKDSKIFASKAGAHPGGVPEPPTLSIALFYIEIFPADYTWKVTEKVFKITFMMNKLAMIISFEIILEK